MGLKTNGQLADPNFGSTSDSLEETSGTFELILMSEVTPHAPTPPPWRV